MLVAILVMKGKGLPFWAGSRLPMCTQYPHPIRTGKHFFGPNKRAANEEGATAHDAFVPTLSRDTH